MRKYVVISEFSDMAEFDYRYRLASRDGLRLSGA